MWQGNKNSLKGLTHRFKKGNVPWNKNKKGIHLSSKSEFKKGLIPWNKDRKYLQISGNKHYNWKGGITPENIKIRASIEYRFWVEGNFARDNYVCQKCGDIRISKLMAHHILNFSTYPELRFAIDNGITFCRDCHKLFHKKYGKRNDTREQVEEFLYGKI